MPRFLRWVLVLAAIALAVWLLGATVPEEADPGRDGGGRARGGRKHGD
jgi:hypothetical protein